MISKNLDDRKRRYDKNRTAVATISAFKQRDFMQNKVPDIVNELDSSRELSDERYTALKNEFRRLQITLNFTIGRMEELEFQKNMDVLPMSYEKIVEHIKQAFLPIKSIKSVHCALTETSEVHIIIIHKGKDIVATFTQISKQTILLQRKLHGTNLIPLILHVSEAESNHTMGTRRIL